jgi:tyrosyl-tRNA synthetase
MKDKLDSVFSRGVSSFIDPGDIFRKKIEEKARGLYKKDIIIKIGVDPTRPDIHLGHAVILRKLRAFQDIGCKVVFLIGDYTTQIGDPTGKSKVRPEISQKEIEENMKTYLAQVGKILKTTPDVFSWIRNSDWFLDVSDVKPKANLRVKLNSLILNPSSFVGKALIFEETRMQKTHLKKKNIYTFSFTRVLSILRQITHARLIDRDMFQDRINGGHELFMHEMLYPVLQGIDSAVIHDIYGSCDLEIGGTDQTFNMLMGRDVMKISKQEEQAVMSMDILEGLDGKEKMSKSLDNYVAITDEPSDMYGKIMSIPDSVIGRYFKLATFTPEEVISEIEENISSGKLHPKDAKMNLAKQIVAMYHGESLAEKAEKSFSDTFSKGEIPKDVEGFVLEKEMMIVEALVASGCVSSKSEARRLIEQGAVTNLDNNLKIESDEIVVPGTYRIGKHRFIKFTK